MAGCLEVAFVRTKRVKGRWYYYLVHNRKVDGAVHQRVLRYLGPVRPLRKRNRAGPGGAPKAKGSA